MQKNLNLGKVVARNEQKEIFGGIEQAINDFDVRPIGLVRCAASCGYYSVSCWADGPGSCVAIAGYGVQCSNGGVLTEAYC